MIRKLFGLEKDVKRCNALVDGEPCGNEAWGWNGTETKRYCEDHIPAEAVPYGGRWDIEWADETDPSTEETRD